MKQLLDQLYEQLNKSRIACSTSQPSNDVGWHFGRQQGICIGLQTAIKMVENFIEAVEDEHDYDDESSERDRDRLRIT